MDWETLFSLLAVAMLKVMCTDKQKDNSALDCTLLMFSLPPPKHVSKLTTGNLSLGSEDNLVCRTLLHYLTVSVTLTTFHPHSSNATQPVAINCYYIRVCCRSGMILRINYQ